MRLISIISALLLYAYTQSGLSLHKVRSLYLSAASSKDSLQKLSGLLSLVDSSSDATLLSYKGAAMMMHTKYALNPLTKLASFKKGKGLLQAAINRDTTEAEPRYLRFTIQTNTPSFLNYAADIEADKLYLLNNYQPLKDAELKKMILEYLSASRVCTPEELKKLKN